MTRPVQVQATFDGRKALLLAFLLSKDFFHLLPRDRAPVPVAVCVVARDKVLQGARLGGDFGQHFGAIDDEQASIHDILDAAFTAWAQVLQGTRHGGFGSFASIASPSSGRLGLLLLQATRKE